MDRARLGTLDVKLAMELQLRDEVMSKEQELQAQVARLEAAIAAKDAALEWCELALRVRAANCKEGEDEEEADLLQKAELARAALSPDAGKGCICGAPGPQPCGPDCNYPYTDRPGKGPFYTDVGKGWLPPEAREQVAAALLPLKRAIINGMRMQRWRNTAVVSINIPTLHKLAAACAALDALEVK